jgi:uncharacterized membrane protein
MPVTFWLYATFLASIAIFALITIIRSPHHTDREFAFFFLVLWVVVGSMSIIRTYEYFVEKNAARETTKLTRQSQEIAAVQEYEANQKISGDRAWWIGLSAEKLASECQVIAEKIGKDWRALVDLLSGKNAMVIFLPQPSTP